MALNADICRVVVICVDIVYAIFGFIAIYYSISLSKKVSKLDWTTAFLMYNGIIACIISVCNSYGAIKKRSKLLTKCAGVILLAIIILSLIIILYWSTDKSENHSSRLRIPCAQIFNQIICQQMVKISWIAMILLTIEIVCLSFTVALIRRLPVDTEWDH